MSTKYWLAVFLASFGAIALMAANGSYLALFILILMVIVVYWLFGRHN